jgi:NAD(P)H-nitrite reductase large subunit
MQPIAPLMIEHRLIERMIKAMRDELDRMEITGEADPGFIETAVDFVRTYADRCHHGKEEDILFRDLEKKPTSDDHKQIINELLEEHRWGRKTTKELLEAKEKYQQGDMDALSTIIDRMKFLVDFYPKHIEKEDRHFFIPVMNYFTQDEKDAMLDEEYEFDRQFIHEKYKAIVREAERRSNMSGDSKGAILQRDEKTYAIVPRTPVGLVSVDQLESIVKVVRKYDIPVVKITSGQRFALVGINKEDVDEIWEDLGMDIGKATELCLHYVQACPGTAVCKFGVQDSLGLGMEIESFFYGTDLPAKVKIGISGCPFCCGESFVRDIGVLGKKTGWTFIVGGSSARRPRVGDVLKDDLSKEKVIDLTKRTLEYYDGKGKKRERMARFVDRIGIENLKEALL